MSLPLVKYVGLITENISYFKLIKVRDKNNELQVKQIENKWFLQECVHQYSFESYLRLL